MEPVTVKLGRISLTILFVLFASSANVAKAEGSAFSEMAEWLNDTAPDVVGGFIFSEALSFIFSGGSADPIDYKKQLDNLNNQVKAIDKEIQILNTSVAVLSKDLSIDTSSILIGQNETNLGNAVSAIQTASQYFNELIESSASDHPGSMQSPKSASKLILSTNNIPYQITHFQNALMGQGSSNGLLDQWTDLLIKKNVALPKAVNALTFLYWQYLYWEFQGIALVANAYQLELDNNKQVPDPQVWLKDNNDKLALQLARYLDNVDRLVLNEFHAGLHKSAIDFDANMLIAETASLPFPADAVQAFAQADFFAAIALGQEPGIRIRKFFRPHQNSTPYQTGAAELKYNNCPAPLQAYEAWWKIPDVLVVEGKTHIDFDSFLVICRYNAPINSFDASKTQTWDMSTFAPKTLSSSSDTIVSYLPILDTSNITTNPTDQFAGIQWLYPANPPPTYGTNNTPLNAISANSATGYTITNTRPPKVPNVPNVTVYSLALKLWTGPSNNYINYKDGHFKVTITPWILLEGAVPSEASVYASVALERTWDFDPSPQGYFPYTTSGGLSSLGYMGAFPLGCFSFNPSRCSTGMVPPVMITKQVSLPVLFNPPSQASVNFDFGGTWGAVNSEPMNTLTTTIIATVHWLRFLGPMPALPPS